MAKSKHTIRIISGTLRGRRVPVLPLEGLRPTGDRLRETVFNWLQFEIAGKNVLDVCAGSGALGFEAASRGAQSVTMVESHRNAVIQLKKMGEAFAIKNFSVEHKRAQDYLNGVDKQFDVVFLDPPFADNLLQELTDLALNRVVDGGFIYREYPSGQEISFLADNWQLYRKKIAGQVKIELWRKKSLSN